MAYHGADQMYPGLSKGDFAPGFIMYPRQEMMKREYNLLNTERSKWQKAPVINIIITFFLQISTCGKVERLFGWW